MVDVALATYARLPQLSAGDALLLPALAERGLRAVPLVWNDLDADWSQPHLTVIRSTWDYHHQRPAFLAWAERVTKLHNLWNPLAMLHWNTHKFYLRDLEHQGLPIIPTLWLEQGSRIDLVSVMKHQGWTKVVLKPAVSASAHATLLITPERIQEGQTHLDQLLPTYDMLLQPFISTVMSTHERSLIFIDGTFAHAVERAPELNLEPSVEDRLIEPQNDELHFARKALALLPLTPLYARVDLIHDEASILRLIELELVEPGLFLALAPHTVQLFADAIARKVK